MSTCAAFADAVDELALGHIDEPERSALLAHAATCTACRARLDEAAALADRLLLLAPEHEPPAGFESRVLDRLQPAHGVPVRRRRWWLGLAAAAAVVVGAALGGMAFGRSHRGSGETVVASGVIVSANGARVGDVELVRDDRPYVLVTIDHPRPGSSEVYCELQLADGERVRVGSWDGPDVAEHVWAVGIPAEYLAAVRMDVTTEDGTVLASATLT